MVLNGFKIQKVRQMRIRKQKVSLNVSLNARLLLKQKVSLNVPLNVR